MIDQAQRVHDLDRWRLLDERGRQTWHYMNSEEEVRQWPQTLIDRHHLGLELVRRISNPWQISLTGLPTGSTGPSTGQDTT